MKHFKIVVETHPDAFVAYPLGLKGVGAGQGDTYESALEDVNSAVKFHLDSLHPADHPDPGTNIEGRVLA